MIDNTEQRFLEAEATGDNLYESAEENLVALSKAQEELRGLLNNKRALTESQTDREMELLAEQRAKHSDMGVGRFEEHLKLKKRSDKKLTEVRNALSQCQSALTQTEHYIELIRSTIRFKVAALEELGGYLHCLAAHKAYDTSQNQE